MRTSRVLLLIPLLCSLASAQPQTKPAYEWVDGAKQSPVAWQSSPTNRVGALADFLRS